MSKSLTLFAGSVGHFTGFYNFVESISLADNLSWTSHLNLPVNLSQNISFYQIKCYPAYVNYEFLLDQPLSVKVELKSKNIFYQRRKQELKRLVDIVKPDVIILDNYAYTDALILAELYRNSPLRIVLYQTRLSTVLDIKSRYGGAWFKKFKWLKSSTILHRKRFDELLNQWAMPGYSDEINVKRLIEKLHLNNVAINRHRYGLPTMTWLPEIILSGQELSNHQSENQHYMGLGFKFKGKEKPFNSPKSIMISMGSRNIASDKERKFLEGLHYIISRSEGIHFNIPPSWRAKLISSNVTHYTWDAYHDQLSQADVHITHGGINSIKDSLSYGVPMLICPLDWRSDQIHNALMFEKQGLSKTWNIKLDHPETILLKIEELLEEDYRHRIMEYVAEDKKRYTVEQVREEFIKLIRDERWEIRNW